jgi:peptidoglycan/xylan/chitin deacetylase (PgdA/CDA1 family)
MYTMGDVLVLCYHAVSRSWPAPLSVLPERLEEQLELLTSRGYRGVTFTEALTAPPHERTLAVTFDDAFASTLEVGLPVLERFGLPGTVFAPADYVDSDQPIAWEGMERWLGTEHEPELRCMTTGELSELRAAGWEVGSHTCSHPKLPALDDEQVEEEVRRSKEVLEEKLGVPCTSIAYPYGGVDERVADAAAAAGYAAGAALATPRGAAGPLRWPRVGSYHTDSLRRFRLKVSPLARRLRLAEARTAVRSALARNTAPETPRAPT